MDPTLPQESPLQGAVIQMPPEPTPLEEYQRDERHGALTELLTELRMERRKKDGTLTKFGVPRSKVVEDLWGFVNSEVVKSNLNQKDFEVGRCLFHAARAKMVDKIAGENNSETFEREMFNLENMDYLQYVRSKRGIGGFERKMQETNIAEQYTSAKSEFHEGQSQGILSRILGTRTRR